MEAVDASVTPCLFSSSLIVFELKQDKVMKEIIKQLAEEQSSLKKTRKTGSNPGVTERERSNRVSWRVWNNKLKITAALNLYHEMRGSDYRHGYDIEHSEYYNKCYKELVAQDTEPSACSGEMQEDTLPDSPSSSKA